MRIENDKIKFVPKLFYLLIFFRKLFDTINKNFIKISCTFAYAVRKPKPKGKTSLVFN